MPPSPAHVVPYSLIGTSKPRSPSSAIASDGSIILTFRFFSSAASAGTNVKIPVFAWWCSPNVSKSQPSVTTSPQSRESSPRTRSGVSGNSDQPRLENR